MILFAYLAVAAMAPQVSKAEIGAQSSVRERQAQAEIGQCIVSEHPAEARALLAMDFRTKPYGKAMQNLIHARISCPGVTVPQGVYRSGSLLWGGSFAEALLLRDHILPDLAAKTAYRADLPNIEARNAGELMAICAIRKDPKAIAALLVTEPATDREYDALQAAGPAFSACVPADSKSAFTRESLRALLALSAYRLAVFNQQGGAK
jgi:hypothetical protein